MPETNNPSVKFVFVSRMDTCAPGERRGLWRLCAEYARQKDAAFVVLAGGLWSGQAIRETLIKLRKRLVNVNVTLRAIDGIIDRRENPTKKPKKDKKSAKPRRLTALVVELEKRETDALRKERGRLEDERDEIAEEMDRYTPANLAREMAEDFPSFADASGKAIKVYIVPSKAYDHDVGDLAARELGKLLHAKGVYVLPLNAARIPLPFPGKGGIRNLEVLVPAKRKLPGTYHSTGPESEIGKKEQQTASRKPVHLQLLGCYGVAISKPKGEYAIPYVTAGMLSRIEESGMTFAENQVCVRLVETFRDRVEPVVSTLSLKDLVSEERKLIGSPGELSDERRRILDVLREEGALSTGQIADRAKLSRKVAEETLKGMIVDRDRNKTWSGLHYHEGSDRWDFKLDWVKKSLRYPLPNGERKVDSILAWGCIHGGAKDVDYMHFRTEAPKVALERDVTVFVGAGDFIEGLKHNLALRGAIMPGFENLTKQETFVGNLQAQVMLDVFRPRFERALVGAGKLNAAQVAELIKAALVWFVYVAGNHDLWAKDAGMEPLVTMRDKMVTYLARHIERILIEKGLPKPDFLRDLVDSKFVQVKDPVGETFLPSGLGMTVAHPHMSRTKTTSIRIQELMVRSPDTHVLISANFHVAEHLEMWRPKIGQRVGIQVGTIKRDSHFEAGKLKIVDQGFAWVRVESIEAKDADGTKSRRIVESTATFYSNGGTDRTKLDPEKAYKDFHKDLGIDH